MPQPPNDTPSVDELPHPHPNARMQLQPIESKAALIRLLEELAVHDERQIVWLRQRLEASNTSLWADGPGNYPETQS